VSKSAAAATIIKPNTSGLAMFNSLKRWGYDYGLSLVIFHSGLFISQLPYCNLTIVLQAQKQIILK
jgi:hypothetical protein